jgi:hypothetical protein
MFPIHNLTKQSLITRQHSALLLLANCSGTKPHSVHAMAVLLRFAFVRGVLQSFSVFHLYAGFFRSISLLLLRTIHKHSAQHVQVYNIKIPDYTTNQP